MKYKCAAVAVLMFIATGLLAWGFYPSLMTGLGNYLVVDEEAGPVDAVVSSVLSAKVLKCYRQGTCKKIFVPVLVSSQPTYREVKQLDAESMFREAARANGVDEKAIDFFRFSYDGAGDFCRYFEKVFAERKIRSALFLFNYYNTRGFRFYFDRFHIPATIYVQPSGYDTAYRQELENWWDKTTLANYFLSEYMRMFYYYFNKALWTPGL